MSNTIKETISLLDEVVSIIGEERPVEPAFANEDPEGWCGVLAWEENASQALADLLMIERRKNQKLQAENAELRKQGEWISVDDELPEFNTVVLVKVYRERGISWPEADYSCTAKLSRVTRHCGENSPIDNRWYVFPSGGTEITRDVTHWMPLPTPPKGE